jgi:hypothetical protein
LGLELGDFYGKSSIRRSLQCCHLRVLNAWLMEMVQREKERNISLMKLLQQAMSLLLADASHSDAATDASALIGTLQSQVFLQSQFLSKLKSVRFQVNLAVSNADRMLRKLKKLHRMKNSVLMKAD